MAEVEVTKMSSRGQVVIPQDIRQRMALKNGDAFAVAASNDTLMLKKIKTPTKEEILKELERLTSKGNKIARKLGIKEKDVPKMIHKARGITE
jgi:AbrB family looped-hinge helix DNA binding protein